MVSAVPATVMAVKAMVGVVVHVMVMNEAVIVLIEEKESGIGLQEAIIRVVVTR